MKRKEYWNMNADELREATQQFDASDAMAASTPLTAADAEHWRKAKRKRGRPQIGKGSQRISVSIERTLLKRVNSFAKRKNLSRSRLLANLLTDALEREFPKDRS